MSKGLPRSLSRGDQSRQEIVKISISVNEAMTFTGSTGVAVDQTAPIGALPEGNICLLGAVANLTFTGPTSADLANDFQGDYGLGSTPADDNTITGADVDLVASTAIAAATAEVSANNRGTGAASIIDNTDGTGEINLNVLLDADEVTNAQSVVITVTGTVDLAFTVLGDD